VSAGTACTVCAATYTGDAFATRKHS
jgi:hypothetical protein